MNTPLTYNWNGEAMCPWPRFAKLADKQFVVGESYRLELCEDRSQATHNHYFASLTEAWRNLPEDTAERFPSVENLRKYALIKAGFADERSIVCASKAEAQRVAAFIRPMDDYAIVVVREATIKVFTAKSQSMRAMGKADFQASKSAVLDIVSAMIGVDSKTLAAQSSPSVAPGPHPTHDHQQELAHVGRGRE